LTHFDVTSAIVALPFHRMLKNRGSERSNIFFYINCVGLAWMLGLMVYDCFGKP
jgi:hypothetical protein